MLDKNKFQRWKLVLGGQSDAGNSIDLKSNPGNEGDQESEGERNLQGVCDSLDALYDSDRRGGLGSSSPKVNRWLGDIQKYFPSTVVSMLQKDAMDRLGVEELLSEPEFLETVEVNIELVTTLMSLSRTMPQKVKESARVIIQKLVKQLEEKLTNPTKQAVKGALSRSVRNNRPKFREIDWDKTIKANMKHYQHAYKTIIPERLIGSGKRGQSVHKNIILCIDQSGSMGSSVVYSGVFGAVLASLPALNTRMVVFDTSVADLTENIKDPVDILFGVQLGGGTDINKALAYCQTLITKPDDTILILITDLYEGGDEKQMLRRVAEIKSSGVNFITLLALNDEGSPFYDTRNAGILAGMDIPCFACTPDQFPSLMAAAIQRISIYDWMNQNDIKIKT
ncbi:MAG: VWA domain-containing protein [Bacteroidia bacterium]|nr:VWA domain-containing protein [Bacteroidia bacterium]